MILSGVVDSEYQVDEEAYDHDSIFAIGHDGECDFEPEDDPRLGLDESGRHHLNPKERADFDRRL